MAFVHNFPFFTIVLCMASGVITSVLHGKVAKHVCNITLFIVTLMSAALFFDTANTQATIIYQMGNFPAPWGNELRASVLEALMAMIFCVIMFFSLIGGRVYLEREIEEKRQPLYYVIVQLLMSSLLALIYTNDLFTAYVFVEINTIASCGLIMIRMNGKTIEAAIRYMIMSLLGSGLFLLGISMMYACTGHLLMSNIRVDVALLMADGTYSVPVMVSIACMTIGIAIKTALYPFHSWLPDAYGYSTVCSSAILSSLVSKGYLFLLIKIFYRTVGIDVMYESGMFNILFVFGLLGMIRGSVNAMQENDIRRMVAYSSVAQIGYIYMGFGLGSTAGMVASIFHIITHGITKSLLFIAVMGLTDVSGYSRRFFDLTGAGFRNKIAGLAFMVGALSMVGIPTLSGFISKLLFSQAAIFSNEKMIITLIFIATSTIYNAVYFMKTVIRIYTPVKTDYPNILFGLQKLNSIGLLLFVVLNFAVGMLSQPLVDMIELGLVHFI
ncbi:MAG: proton-conducting transporter membrane subunit [Eubacteriales bacterium]